jgi:hypothetical protein
MKTKNQEIGIGQMPRTIREKSTCPLKLCRLARGEYMTVRHQRE